MRGYFNKLEKLVRNLLIRADGADFNIMDKFCEACHRHAMTVAFPFLLGELLFFGAYYPARKTSGGSRRDGAIYHCRITFSESMSCRTLPASGKLMSA